MIIHYNIKVINVQDKENKAPNRYLPHLNATNNN
jgi:hypothetical protein